MLVLLILAVVWAAVLLPPFVRNRRDGRPDNSVVSFRAQLSTLERATPGTSLRLGDTDSEVAARAIVATRLPSNDQKRRRREVLLGLLGATGLTFLLLVAVGGTFLTLLFLASAGSLGAYVYALRQIHVRALERAAKVRPLVPRHVQASQPMVGAVRTATN